MAHLLDVLATDHRRILDLVDTARRRGTLESARVARRSLEAHERREEQVLHPVARRCGEHAAHMVDVCNAEENGMTEMLSAATAGPHADRHLALGGFRAALANHCRSEEEWLLPALVRALGPDRERWLAGAYARDDVGGHEWAGANSDDRRPWSATPRWPRSGGEAFDRFAR